MSHAPLSHDQRHAAESAFQGQPYQPQWGRKAFDIYDGIFLVRWGAPPPRPAADLPSTLPRSFQPDSHYQWRIGLQNPTQIIRMIFPKAMTLLDVTQELRQRYPHRPFSILRGRLLSPPDRTN